MPGDRLLAFHGKWEAGKMARKGQHSSGRGGYRLGVDRSYQNAVREHWGKIGGLSSVYCLQDPKPDTVTVLTLCFLEQV